MRMRSAYLAILLAAAAGTTLSATACTPDTDSPAAPVVTENPVRVAADRRVDALREQYDWLGAYHTDGLVFVYNRLAASRGRLNRRSDLCRTAAKAVKEYHRIARKSEVPLGLVDPSLTAEVCDVNSVAPVSNRRAAPGPRIRTNQLSPSALGYIDQVYTAINSATSRTALLSALRSIEYSAIANLSDLEAGAIIGVVSIAISSMDYWEANLDNWVTLPGLDTPYNRLGETVREVGGQPMSAVLPRWWNIPFIQGYRQVLVADAIGGARVLFTTWMAGPVGWDAAAAAALWSSTTMALSLLF